MRGLSSEEYGVDQLRYLLTKLTARAPGEVTMVPLQTGLTVRVDKARQDPSVLPEIDDAVFARLLQKLARSGGVDRLEMRDEASSVDGCDSTVTSA